MIIGYGQKMLLQQHRMCAKGNCVYCLVTKFIELVFLTNKWNWHWSGLDGLFKLKLKNVFGSYKIAKQSRVWALLHSACNYDWPDLYVSDVYSPWFLLPTPTPYHWPLFHQGNSREASEPVRSLEPVLFLLTARELTLGQQNWCQLSTNSLLG